MAKLFDRVGQSTATTGTGTVTLGAVITDSTNGDLATFTDMGAVATDSVNYLIVDGNNWELGTGTLGGTGPGFTMTRSVTKSKISGTVGTTALTLSGSAKVYSVPASSLANQWANSLVLGVGFGDFRTASQRAIAFPNAAGLGSPAKLGVMNGSLVGMSTGDLYVSFGNGGGAVAFHGDDYSEVVRVVPCSSVGYGGRFTLGSSNQLLTEAADTHAFTRSTNSQTLRVYGSSDNATGVPTTNYSRLSLKHAGGTAGATIATEAGGTGTAGPLKISGVFSSTIDPTTTDLPSGQYMLAKNTTGGSVKLWYNDGGTLKSVALT